ncbi:hybrid sensory histidine kinase BarA [Paenibacillus sp. P1XP2]|nr:hybrid sensory histidine kinase BarA [Paenibacillus sp. P1XP2]
MDKSLASPGYHYIFMDLQMPVMDGLEAAKRIRQRQKPANRTPVIVAMTANVMEASASVAWKREWTTTSANLCR